MLVDLARRPPMTTDEYRYWTILPDRETRFVNILPGAFDAPIECEIFHRHLVRSASQCPVPTWGKAYFQALLRQFNLATPSYEALSYAWGSPTQARRRITMDGKHFEVAQSLETALRYLRLLDRPRTMWIDAICIDQQNLVEKSQQLKRMRVIYEEAAEVLVWLGRPTEPEDSLIGQRFGVDGFWNPEANYNSEGTDVAFSFIQMCARAYEQYTANGVFELSFEDMMKKDGRLKILAAESHNIDAADLFVWIELGRLFWRPWFSRVWVFQEYLLAAKASIVCGHQSLSGKAMTAFLKLLMFRLESQPHMTTLMNMAGTERAVKMMLQTNFSLLKMPPEDELLAWLLHTTHLAATDPRDKIYAILGPRVAKCLKPNYSKTVMMIYDEVARLMLRKSPYLDILCLCNPANPSTDGVASWVADWRKTDPALSYYPEQLESLDSLLVFQVFMTLSIYQRTLYVWGSGPGLSWGYNYMRFLRLQAMAQHAKHPEQLPLDKPFRRFKPPPMGRFAGGRGASGATFSPDGKVLMLTGFTTDHITCIGPPQQPVPEGVVRMSCLSEAHQTAFDEWDKMFYERMEESHIYATKDDSERAYARLISVDDMVEGDGGPCSDNTAAALAFQVYQSLRRMRPSPGERFTLDDPDGGISSYMNKLVAGCAGSSFFITERGYIGLTVASHQAKVGDQVCLLRGARMPLILRKADAERHRLVGRCYVQGMMRGEVWERSLKTGTPLESFSLI